MEEEMHLPPPGADGTWRDSCIVCLQGTDTALGFEGDAEWVISGLFSLGVPLEQAGELVSRTTGCDPGMVPMGTFRLAFRVCQECVDKSGIRFPLGLALMDQIPYLLNPEAQHMEREPE